MYRPTCVCACVYLCSFNGLLIPNAFGWQINPSSNIAKLLNPLLPIPFPLLAHFLLWNYSVESISRWYFGGRCDIKKPRERKRERERYTHVGCVTRTEPPHWRVVARWIETRDGSFVAIVKK